ncbi:hypothetical protein [Diaphorobacter sp.]|uniref:hypothetical protein n=1 Tax=Diaphorobacter sp. TaxID=1934310 RepID=UPI0028AF2E9C|nr:hypothetical protein [Diaphorobacter sp.]
MSEVLPLAARILLALAQEQGARGDDAAVSLPRLSKALGLSASALMRELTLMSDAQVGAQRGPGWVTVSQRDGRWLVALTPAGRAVLPE